MGITFQYESRTLSGTFKLNSPFNAKKVASCKSKRAEQVRKSNPYFDSQSGGGVVVGGSARVALRRLVASRLALGEDRAISCARHAVSAVLSASPVQCCEHGIHEILTVYTSCTAMCQCEQP